MELAGGGALNLFFKSTIFVLSRLDSCDKANAQAVQDKFTSQITSLAQDLGLSATPQVISVSALNYLKGKNEGKKLLVKSSHIERLKDMIANAKQELHNPAHQLKVLEEKKSQLVSSIDGLLQTLQAKKNEVLNAKKTFKKQMADDLEQANKALKEMY